MTMEEIPRAAPQRKAQKVKKDSFQNQTEVEDR